MNLLKLIEKKTADRMSAHKIPAFKAGDTVKVSTKVIEGKDAKTGKINERIQMFEGVCISRKNAGINSAFTVRKISFGEGVEKVFPLYSPNVAKIELVKHGKVRRSKLYYLRSLFGKKARISEDLAGAAKAREADREEQAAAKNAAK
ncbi:MAG: 50S ribosomal protein L19 [Rickettsiales bacterium]|jgi:large subunit ribosomal protein L19|nr:50S ribosomal protein L19 [Rickettsiales bacterium]